MLTYEMVTGDSPGEDEESPPVDEVSLQQALTREAFFVNFLRTDEYDEDGVRSQTTYAYVQYELKTLVFYRVVVR